MTTVRANIDALIAYYESMAATLRVTRELHVRHLLPPPGLGALGVLNGNGHEGPMPLPTHKKPRRRKAATKTTSAATPAPKKLNVKAKRTATAKLLAKISRVEPVPSSIIGPAIGTYVRRGYLTKKGDGYVRTAKEFRI